MLFNSIQFLVFFPIVLLVYFLIPDKIKYLWLLAASYFFYMCWNAKYALLLLASTVITYLAGLLMEKAQTIRMKKLTVAASFILNIGILFYFKYFNFAFELLHDVFARLNIELNTPAVDVLLPVGISFYTFQALGYTMDVYRKEIYAEKNFFRYALFVSFFPQLVAGPIERSKNLLKQLSEPKRFVPDNAREGFLMMLWGYFMKMVLADRIAVFVDTVYGDHQQYGGYYIIIATMLFAVQIYCDFAGYSTIAMGSAKVLGINLMENFDAPLLSTSVADFWRRWHMSLMSWFKDYLYIPLGGSRKGKLRKYFNVMVVFLVSGLWHGAKLTYIAWGGLNGIYQIIGETLRPVRDRISGILRINTDSLGHRILKWAVTFILVNLSLIFFRADRLLYAIEMTGSVFRADNPWVLFDGSLFDCGLDEKNFNLMLVCILIFLIADYCKRKKIVIRNIIMKQDFWFRCLFVSLAVMFILIFGKYGSVYDAAGFIYFQF